MSTVPLFDARSKFCEIAEKVERTHERVHITKNGRAFVVLMARSDLEQLEATLELATDAAALSRLSRAEADVVAGLGVSHLELAASVRGRKVGAR